MDNDLEIGFIVVRKNLHYGRRMGKGRVRWVCGSGNKKRGKGILLIRSVWEAGK